MQLTNTVYMFVEKLNERSYEKIEMQKLTSMMRR
jgi:hypothetical protein